MQTEEIFSLTGVRFSYARPPAPPAWALDGLDLTISRNEALAVLGANGSGKSTLLRLLDALLYPVAGEILAFGQRLCEAAMAEEGFARRFRQQVGLVMQNSDAQLFNPTVLEEVAFGPLQLGLPDSEVLRRSETIFELLQIGHLRHRSPDCLSAGEKKRVAVACILATSPDVLLLDEPTAGLDPRSREALLDLLVDRRDAGQTIVLATQDLELVRELAHRAVVLGEDHRLAASGPANEIVGDRELLRAANLVGQERRPRYTITAPASPPGNPCGRL